jgi:glucan phosphoethanolaminetransferase (alkaline phosphatase superfamily)
MSFFRDKIRAGAGDFPSLAALAPLAFLTLWGAKPDAMPLVLASGAAFLALAALCWRPPWSRAAAVLLAFCWALNTTATVLCKIEYDGIPSTYMAGSVLATNPAEAAGMVSDHLEYVLLLVILWLAGAALARRLCIKTPVRALRVGAGVLLAFLIILPSMYAARHRSLLQVTIRTLTKTPFYHAAALIASRATAGAGGGAGNTLPAIKTRETGIDIHVLIIGESARRKNMSLHGAARDTTPRENAERARMLVFSQAVAPAGNTLATVPRTLRPVDAGGNLSSNYKDNIITLANRAGFQTFWLSNQEDYNPNYAIITEIMKEAVTVSWKHGDYDEALLPGLDSALRAGAGRKKFIILHFRGSHEPPGGAYPKRYAKFSGSADGPGEDEYDNSIHYTDAVLGMIFDRLRGEKASVLYYSDHALIRKRKLWWWKYRHGGGVREAYEVPLWIWWSPPVPAPARLGGETAPYSTSANFHLLKDWLGIEEEGVPCASPLRADWRPPEVFVDGKIPFSSLPAEK